MTADMEDNLFRISISVCVLLLLASPAARAQSAGTFTPTGSMTIPRGITYTSTLLPNGKVLIAGGNSATAELYDPATGTFTRTGDMTAVRSLHSAVLLPNGKVLVAGGVGVVPLASAELYDPFTGTFSPAGDMAHAGATAAFLLANGNVLIALGPTPGNPPQAAEIYDPVTGTFSSTSNQPATDSLPELGAPLADGRVLIVICCTAELFDPNDGAFAFTGAMTGVYEDGIASALPARGKVLVTGGYVEEGGAISSGACLYDSTIGTFSATGNMNTARYYHTATALGDGTVLVAGGQVGTRVYTATASAEIYDPAAGTFSPTGDMTTGRINHTATLLLDGTVLIAGGEGLTSAENYHPARPIPAPVLFSLGGDAQGQGAIWQASTGEVATAAHPAAAGDVLSLYTTGLVESGAIPPQVAVGGRFGETLYFGDAPGYPGYYQVNFRVPDGVSPGATVPVRLTYLGRPSNAVTIGVR
jgi:hypothetical protein